jgi:hypothetical protein
MEKRLRRPFLVTLVACGVLLLGGGYLLQSGQAFSRYVLDDLYPLSVPAWSIALTGALWGVVWLVLGTGLWRRREWARRFTLIALPLQLAFWLADECLFSRSTVAIQSIGFDLILRLLAAAFVAAVLLLFGGWEGTGRAAAAAQKDPGRENRQPHVE